MNGHLFAAKWAVLFCGFVSSLGGCMVGPDYKPPEGMKVFGWTGTGKASQSQPSVATSQPADLANWWQTFKDPKLTQLVQRSIQGNLNLKIAQSRLQQSRAQLGITVAPILPQIDNSNAYQKLRPAGRGDNINDQELYKAGLDASWEIDVFGGRRRGIESAMADIEATAENLRNTLVVLVAEVAFDYIMLRGYQKQIAIARDNLESQQHTANITRQRLKAGFVSSLDVANADAQVYTTESTISRLEMSATQTIYAISILLGMPPAGLSGELSQAGAIPVAPAEIPVGLPSDLLRRRPDIRAAEAQIHSATAQIGVAASDMFPKFYLTGGMNWQNSKGSLWMDVVSRSWSFGPTMNWAIFHGGAILSNVKVQETLCDQAMLTYQQIVLSALQEVENALIAFNKEQEYHRALNNAVEANRKAVEISMQLYAQGQTDFLNVLNAERSLFVSEDALAASDRNVATYLIALYKALGGGWDIKVKSTTQPVGESANDSSIHIRPATQKD